MYCPVCSAVTVETSKLICPASFDGPDEYLEYFECIFCGWTDLPIVYTEEEIPF